VKKYEPYQPGEKVHSWTLIEYIPSKLKTATTGYVGAKWKARCVCGKVKEVVESNLRQKLSKSCGCEPQARARETLRKWTSHGAEMGRTS
jgi:hypothetical protein